MSSVQVTKPVLYSYWRSSCSWRVRIALNLKEIDYDIKAVSLIKNGGEQHTAEFREMNPMSQLPAFVVDGNTYTESLAILEYLEATHPDIPLLPEDEHKRTKVRELCQMIASGIQPLQNLAVLNHVGDEKKKEWACHWITRGFNALEKTLETTAGKYCVGDEITMADCCLVPQLYNARRFQLDLEPYPNIVRIDQELENHPAFKAAHPNSQPDCPPEAKLAVDDGDQLSASFQSINPMGRVPALEIGGNNVIIESPAIMEYLNERYPLPPLLPADPIERVKVRSICQIIISDIQPLQNSTSVLSKIEEEKRRDWARFWINKGFTGRYCVGNTVTLADCCLVPQVFNAKSFQVDLGPFPKIRQISHELEKITAFQRAHPYLQPDCPEVLKGKICQNK
ncbi:Hypothetical predicted protein [Cloeon dipterum]|uniref:Maleylacetoacetate isomerase n=1 Tax=Cloeon dipterum TaxID=197152 RepID=A0A8S1DBQ1_9INSE|nr:Hypothetical predicted protein [Cloeon dipterum]